MATVDRFTARAHEAVSQVLAALEYRSLNTLSGDLAAKDALAHAGLALDTMRRILEQPVLAAPRAVARNSSTIPEVA